jgi:hypothetical protein
MSHVKKLFETQYNNQLFESSNFLKYALQILQCNKSHIYVLIFWYIECVQCFCLCTIFVCHVFTFHFLHCKNTKIITIQIH